MQWFVCIFKPASSKFVRQIIGPKAFGDRPYSEQDKNMVWNEIHDLILPRLEQHLKDKQRKFFCSEDEITIVDLQYYYELMQISCLDQSKKITENEFPELSRWMTAVK